MGRRMERRRDQKTMSTNLKLSIAVAAIGLLVILIRSLHGSEVRLDTKKLTESNLI